MENVVTKKLLLALPFVLLPSLASADPQLHIYEAMNMNFRMMRDGSMKKAISEGRENVESFQRLKAAERQNGSRPSAYTAQSRRRR
jgi:hypothetical protein